MKRGMEERRLSPRFTYRKRIKYWMMSTPIRNLNEGIKEGTVLDLSNGGMKIKTEKLGFVEGLILKVLLPFPKIKVAVPVLAEVRWAKEEKPGTVYAGLSFIA